MVRLDFQNVLSFQVNQIRLEGELFIPSHSEFLAVLILEEKEDKFSERFSKMRTLLNEKGIATLLLKGLLTQDEREIHANRSDTALLSYRLSEITKRIKLIEGAEFLKISYIGLSSVAARMFRAAANSNSEVESLILIGNGLQEYDGNFPETSILNILGELDFTGKIINRSILSKIGTLIKRVYFVPGSPNHFEDNSKWSLVSEAIQRWYSFPQKRTEEFSEFL
ncbi:dienelactone hydrolase [Leptospira sarikeiensis]|uniref:Dienelactone hydrolase n=2 Tax=Leptospira sarikeiensis TaxID=2484943 RepID=A0A4R9K107_9LEPT|nr:dienelactone hydrolase [Leptospira sarikeiensis]